MVHPDFVSEKRDLPKLYTRCEEQYDHVWKVQDLGIIFHSLTSQLGLRRSCF
jgi:hypothetical protein